MKVAGIDGGTPKLNLCIQKNGQYGKVKTFTNTSEGHQALIKVLKKAKLNRVCLEVIGVYHLDLAVALYDANRFEIMVVNPKAAKRFAKATLT